MPNTTSAKPVDPWKHKYQRQQLLIEAIISLMQKYGDTTNIDSLRSTFLLTMMGHYVTGDACYYGVRDGDLALHPETSYGRRRTEQLPLLRLQTPFCGALKEHRRPTLIMSLPSDVVHMPELTHLSEIYRVVAPLCMKDKPIGLLFLGAKVSGEPFHDIDMEVMEALCAVSAATFNNAILYQNAKMGAQEIKQLYDMRTEVIGRITHEFRTPLTVIRAGIEPLGQNSNYTELHGWLLHAVDRLEELISDLLRLSAELPDDGDRAFVGYDPMPTIHDAVVNLSDKAVERDVRMVIKRDPASDGATVRMGRRDLATVVDALIDNAVKFAPESSTVLIEVNAFEGIPSEALFGTRIPDWEESARRQSNEYAPSPDSGMNAGSLPAYGDTVHWLLIRVSDTGIGIPHDDIRFIAEPFRQASNSPDLGVKGSGLGLALVQKIVSQYRGVVFCRSDDSRGATFSILIPTY